MVRTTVMLNLSKITPCIVVTIRSVAMFVTIAHVVSLPTQSVPVKCHRPTSGSWRCV